MIGDIRNGSQSVADCMDLKKTYDSLSTSLTGTQRERRCLFGGGGLCHNTFKHAAKTMMCSECTQEPSVEGSLRSYYNLLTGGKKELSRRHCHIFGDDDKSHKHAGNYRLLPNIASVGISPSAVYKKTPQEHTGDMNALAQKMENIYISPLLLG